MAAGWNKIEYNSGAVLGKGLIFIREGGSIRGSRGATFRCQCGKEFLTSIKDVKAWHVVSCGCQKALFGIGNRVKTHGLSNKSPEYHTWKDIKKRCYNCNSSAYHNYGGRGITVSAEWRNSFETFLSDMGRRPSSNHSIERVKNDEGYSKDNCVWATRYQQSRNRRNNVVIEYNGVKKCMIDWASELGINYKVLKSRIKYGWTIEKAFTEPIKIKNSCL